MKLVIPLESDPELVQDSKPPAGAPHAPSEASEIGEQEPSPASDQGDSASDQASGDGVATPPESTGSVEPLSSPDPAHPADADPSAESVDPIAEAPHALWYVQPPSGGQYGPASGDIMRTWISEGRITRDSLVWREGWPDWKLAGPLFPGLLSGPTVIVDTGAGPIVTETSEASIADRYRRKKSTKTALTVVVLLVLACLALFATLIYVIAYMP